VRIIIPVAEPRNAAAEAGQMNGAKA
jgi:hypothetical protein